MPVAVWPAALPQQPITEGYVEGLSGGRKATEMDAGPPKLRRRFTAVAYPVDVTYRMSPTALTAFIEFVRDTLQQGSLPFLLPHPRTGAQVLVQFRDDDENNPSATPYKRGTRWHVKLGLLVLP